MLPTLRSSRPFMLLETFVLPAGTYDVYGFLFQRSYAVASLQNRPLSALLAALAERPAASSTATPGASLSPAVRRCQWWSPTFRATRRVAARCCNGKPPPKTTWPTSRRSTAQMASGSLRASGGQRWQRWQRWQQKLVLE